ncbi:hypothetical protein TSMEX_008692 [Taenia solium]|eukprot:TsM_000682000 transcript=TsM_000682000 gene=TsM_000682000
MFSQNHGTRVMQKTTRHSNDNEEKRTKRNQDPLLRNETDRPIELRYRLWAQMSVKGNRLTTLCSYLIGVSSSLEYPFDILPRETVKDHAQNNIESIRKPSIRLAKGELDKMKSSGYTVAICNENLPVVLWTQSIIDKKFYKLAALKQC